MNDPQVYEAFISYRHCRPDRQWAEWLQKSIETYRVPRRLVRDRGMPPRLKHVFRDEEELHAAHSLSKEIESALERSKWLIVVCSPRTLESDWVDKEIAKFCAWGRHDNILALLIEGEPSSAFPPRLRELRAPEPTGNPSAESTDDPLAADVRGVGRWPFSSTAHVARLRIMATLLGCGFDDLRQRDRLRRRRRAWTLGLILTMAAALAGVLVAKTFQAHRLASLTAAVQAEIDRTDFATPSVSTIQSLIDDLSRLDPDGGRMARSRFLATFTRNLREAIHQPSLEEEHTAWIEDRIDVFENLDPQGAETLRGEYGDRLSEWQEVFVFCPAEGVREGLPESAIATVNEDGSFRLTPWHRHNVPYPSTGRVRLEVTLGQWVDVEESSISLYVNSDSTRFSEDSTSRNTPAHYEFRVRRNRRHEPACNIRD